MDKQKIATEALAFNKHLPSVFLAMDGQVFGTKNDAVNYANRLDDRSVEVFERGGDEPEVIAGKAYALNAKDTMKLIDDAQSEDAVNHILVDEERKTVLAAAEKQIGILKTAALATQAANADAAKKNRENENPNNVDTTSQNEQD